MAMFSLRGACLPEQGQQAASAHDPLPERGMFKPSHIETCPCRQPMQLGARRSIHAWPEACVPSTGWQGFGPATDERVAVALPAVHASCATPKKGSHFGNARCTLPAEIPVHVDA
jgi:hypothetical protein